MAGGRLGRADAVEFAVQVDRGCRDRWPRRQPLLDRLERRIAFGISKAMAVGLDGDVDEIRIVERGCAALEGRVVERPIWRPQPPDQLAEFAPVRREPGAAALGVEIVLIPEAMLLLGRR